MFDSEIAEFYTKITQQTIAYRKSNKIHRNDFLQLFMQLHYEGQGLTMQQLTANAFLFVLAGYETTSSTMTYFLYEVSRNEEIQRRLQAEIDKVTKNENFNYEKLKELKFLEKCLNETLRKYPIVPVLNRVCDRDYKIDGTSLFIPAGTSIVIPLFGIQRDAQIFENPLNFNPNRELSEDSLVIPFGIGQRACIGTRMAMVVAKLTLSMILSKFNLKLIAPMTSELTFSPKVAALTANEKILIEFTHR